MNPIIKIKFVILKTYVSKKANVTEPVKKIGQVW